MSDINYRPIQPGVHHSGDPRLRYSEFLPSATLRHDVYCYWTLRSTEKLEEPFAYRIVSDGCLDLFMNCRDFDGLTIAGTADSATVVLLSGEVHFFGIRFLPGRFRHFFDLPLKEIVNQMLPLREVLRISLNQFESQLFAAGSDSQRIVIAETHLLNQLIKNSATPDPRMTAMLTKIYQHNGWLSIEKHLSDGISVRQLRRLFDAHFGVSPKTFARIVRFQAMLQVMRQSPKSEWGKRCYDVGYYDQPHFIREFKALFGLSPSEISDLL